MKDTPATQERLNNDEKTSPVTSPTAPPTVEPAATAVVRPQWKKLNKHGEWGDDFKRPD